MIHSELLDEKYRVQKKLSVESKSVKEYLKNSHQAAKAIAKKHGFSIKYAEIPNKSCHNRKAFEQVLKL